MNGAQRTERAEKIVKDHKVKNYLYASIDKTILKTIMKKETSKDLWDSMKKKYQGNERVKSAQLQRLRRNFEILEMRRGEKVEEYVSRVMEITNDMRNLGEEMPDFKVVEKILRTLTEKFTHVVCAIEESNDVKTLTVDGLQSSLAVHELNLMRDDAEEKVLKVEGQYWRPDGGRGGSSSSTRGRGRGNYQGRGRGSPNKNLIECYKCHKMGHYKSECPTWEREANYVEMEEDLLLMAHVEHEQMEEKQIWFLDSGCSNHMCGTKDWFIEFDEGFKQNVKLGDDRVMAVEGRGKVRLEIEGRALVISDVYFVPRLKNNLFSVGQLQQKGLRIIIEEDSCEVWHKQEKKMVMRSTMSKNKMFVIPAIVRKGKEMEENKCLQVIETSDNLRKVVEVIAAKASELETEVVRLQYELVTEKKEAAAVMKKLRSEISRKSSGIEKLKKEVTDLKSVKEENEKRTKELETKLGTLEVKELEERNEKLQAEEVWKKAMEVEIDSIKENNTWESIDDRKSRSSHVFIERGLKNKNVTVSFDEKGLRDFLTGFHKRKKKRRKEAQRNQEEALRRKRIEARAKRKLEDQMVAGHGEVMEDGEEGDEDEEIEEAEPDASTSGTTMYDTGEMKVTVTTSEIDREEDEPVRKTKPMKLEVFEDMRGRMGVQFKSE